MANGSRHSLYQILESAYGMTPANPKMKRVRHTSCTIGSEKDSIMSEELRSDRQIADFRLGQNKVGGSVGYESSTDDSFLEALEALLCGTWMPSKTTGQATIGATANTFTGSGFAFVSGDVIVASGFTNAGNNGRFRLTAATATVLTATPLDGQTMAVETAAAARQIDTFNATLKAGTTRRSFSTLRWFEDLGGSEKAYQLTAGIEAASADFKVATNAIGTVSMEFIGQTQAVSTTPPSGATLGAASTYPTMDAFTGTVKEGGSAIAVVTEIGFKLDNGIDRRFVIGSKNTIRPQIGKSNVSGTMSAYFESSTLLDKFLSETASSLEFTLTADIYSLGVKLPNIKYTGGKPDVSGEGSIILSMPFQAVYSSADASQIVITRSAT